jgi:hypothetical protein
MKGADEISALIGAPFQPAVATGFGHSRRGECIAPRAHANERSLTQTPGVEAAMPTLIEAAA